MCNSEGLVIPVQVCKIGMICLGDVSTGLTKQERSCMILETVGTLYPCKHGVIYKNITANRGWSSNNYPDYFMWQPACCNNGKWLSKWMRDIGEAIGQKNTF